MSNIKTATEMLAQRRTYKALIERGRAFMRDRQAIVADEDCLLIMIMACIAEGARTRDDIVRNVPRFVGFGYAEVASVLDRFSGPTINDGYWYRDDNKAYHLQLPVVRIEPPVDLRTGPILRKRKPSTVADLDQPY
ncbi:hypothetical protein [Sphingomonas bacterium]|uniref:hypothetical protein n=1 Tax=Sphingomonas bacterium TaxID=1895847 RepID=UPI0015760740|nr:hypothetical protein [Sphingomonas bacterium]